MNHQMTLEVEAATWTMGPEAEVAVPRAATRMRKKHMMSSRSLHCMTAFRIVGAS